MQNDALSECVATLADCSEALEPGIREGTPAWDGHPSFDGRVDVIAAVVRQVQGRADASMVAVMAAATRASEPDRAWLS